MTILKNKHGAWINQYAMPSDKVFSERAIEVDYVVIKYAMVRYERLAQGIGKAWVAERMAESGAGSQNGPARAREFANELANQALQKGCIAAVINLEEADGGWHRDGGAATNLLIDTFKSRTGNMPLFASIDTRGNRPNYPYQQVCAQRCEGVMPMVYPGEFKLSANASFQSSLTPLMRQRWLGKEIIPTYQLHSTFDYVDEMRVIQRLYNEGIIQGANSYTLGHASGDQWRVCKTLNLSGVQVPNPPVPDVSGGLIAVRELWKKQWSAIAERGTLEEANALVEFWNKLTGSK